ncbi:hypothetical protein CTEN210_05574 [Chaetoceros tenuissimus]|uniref:Uncharacterized protein n=1 Tax=Chaetoceros tenuissimus TaxID=426638 RepID=A0AAD3H3W4_9STRA|nr:hypothetical protein CTEN210_05574 [Chaetoceros tenuissimus]
MGYIRKGLSFFIALIQATTLANEATCTFCPNPNHTQLAGESVKFSLSDGSFVSCSQAEQMVADGLITNCTNIHSAAETFCNCDDPNKEPEEFQCKLCGDANELPFPDRVVGEKTCDEWQTDATNDFEMDCPSYQKSFGAYCGCDTSAPGFFDGFCRICGDSILSKPNQTVTFQSSQGNQFSKSCAKIEQDVNTDMSLDCESIQNDFSTRCKCGWDIEVPSLPPTTSTETNSGTFLQVPTWMYLPNLIYFVCFLLS